MKQVVATAAPEFRTEPVRIAAWAYAAVLTIMIVGQLFAFEKFIPVLQKYQLAGGYGTAVLAACVIVIIEVFALPFLLRMRLSPLMRGVSKVFCIAAPTIWLLLALYAYMTDAVLENGGMFGTKVSVPLALQVLLSTLYLLAAIYIVYGIRQKHKK